MNFLFQRKHKYETHTAIEDVRQRIKSLRKSRWYDVAINFTGNIQEDDSFTLKTKQSLGAFTKGLVKTFVFLEGQLIADNTSTKIDVTVRPNYVVVLLFYVLACFVLYDLYDFVIHVFTTDLLRAGTILIILLFNGFLITRMMNSITNRFEEFMLLGKRD